MKRESFSIILILGVSGLLFSKLFFLQIISGKNQVARAENNRFRIRTINAPRGLFLDNQGGVLVENSAEQNFSEKNLDVDKNSAKPNYLGYVRNYLYAKEMAHVLGYLGEANEEELSFFGVDLGREVGKAGLERQFNNVLKGKDGGEVEEYSAIGEKIRSISRKEPEIGDNVILTINKDLQVLAYQLLEKEDLPGVIIVSKPDGRILSLVSYPSFDSNLFSRNLVGEQVNLEEIFDSEKQMMFNRAISGTYPPASIFKIVTSLAALEEGIIDGNYQIEDTGIIELGGSKFTNWYYTGYGKTDGMVDVAKAIQRSNDIFYYKVGGELGIEKLAFWARKLGLGKLSGIDLMGENAGLVPDREWKQNKLGEDWYNGETYITAIGQGNLLVTPLQINNLTNLVASGGFLCQPKLIVGTGKQVIKMEEKFDEMNCEKVNLNQNNLELVKEGMRKVCENGGTAWPFFNFTLRQSSGTELKIDGVNFLEASESGMIRPIVAGKTGTAETGIYQEKDGNQIQTLHAWFAAFAPYNDPEIVVTVFLEGGGQGSDKPAIMAREIMRFYFEKIKTQISN